MSLPALPTLLLLPPMNCLVAACAGMALRRRRAGRVLLGAGLAGLVVFALPAVSRGLLRSLESGLLMQPPIAPAAAAAAASGDTAPQAIVILSGDQQAFIGQGDVPGPLTLERERAGAALARATGLPVLVTGGALHPWSPSLASQMAVSLRQDFGVVPRWQETASLDTWQNARNSAAMLRNAGISRVYVVTHAWHMRRSLLAFRRAGLVAVAAPVGLDAPERLRLDSFIPAARSWLESYYAVHEWLGCAWYALRG